MSSRQTYGCLGAIADLVRWAAQAIADLAAELWSAVVLEAVDRWRQRKGGGRG